MAGIKGIKQGAKEMEREKNITYNERQRTEALKCII